MPLSMLVAPARRDGRAAPSVARAAGTKPNASTTTHPDKTSKVGRGGLRCACGGRCPTCSDAGAPRAAADARQAVPAQPVSQALQSPSRPIAPALRAPMQSAFGLDLSGVRLHDGPAAAASARALQAEAWTWGRDIVFASGAYRPETPRGQALLAHELVHVAQHEGVPAASVPAQIGARDDAAENAAHAHVRALNAGRRPAIERSARPRLQRSFVSGLLDVLLFVPRLFGAEAYPAEQLREYLEALKAGKGPTKTLFSDNKARACIKRESELGPYDTQTKIWLVQDLLHGWTSGPDERAIIDLLRRSSDRDAVVAGVGRALLWDNFSGRNRREIEALTMTAADAGDALVERLRGLDRDKIQDYVSHAVDPKVRADAQRALVFASMTAPVPSSAAVNAAGHADFVINGVQVIVEPDRIDPSVGTHAFTHSNFVFTRQNEIPETAANAGDPVADVAPPDLQVTLWTTYASESQKRGPSGYGVGTRPEDEKTLQAHERAHGQGWFDFLRDNPPPSFGPLKGLTVSQYNTAARAWNQAAEDYRKRAGAFAQQAGDCVGTLPTDAQLEGTGFTAAICHSP